MNEFTLHTSVLLLTAAMLAPSKSLGDTEQRVLVVREGKTADLQDEAMTFKLLKIRGYSVDVRHAGIRQKLKFGDALTSKDSACSITFHEISPETRIARFHTDCP